MRPLIAVIGKRATRADGLRFSATVAAEALCEAVLDAGGEPSVLHVGRTTLAMAELPKRLSTFAGIVLPGGGDLSARRYGQEQHPLAETADEWQDECDLAVARAAVADVIPTLAICRGMQVLNVACGGTLVQHLPVGSLPHRDATHTVMVQPGSRLRDVLGAAEVDVSSYHHQAVHQLGRDLVVTARAGDGCIEAVEHRTADVLGVQWHPEDQAATHAHDHALFADLVERAQARKETAA